MTTLLKIQKSSYTAKRTLSHWRKGCARGHKSPRINLFAGDDTLDHYYDIPPYKPDEHLKLLCSKYVSTSFGMFVLKST